MHILDLMHGGNIRKPGQMALSSGKVIDLLNFDAGLVDIYDIAVGLCNASRFGGQTETRYSVAQHCMLVASLCPPRLRALAYLHDAEEAFWGDMITPIKDLLRDAAPGLLEKMKDCRMAILAKYGVEWDDEIKFYDSLALQIEIGVLYGGSRQVLPEFISPIDFSRFIEGELSWMQLNAVETAPDKGIAYITAVGPY